MRRVEVLGTLTNGIAVTLENVRWARFAGGGYVYRVDGGNVFAVRPGDVRVFDRPVKIEATQSDLLNNVGSFVRLGWIEANEGDNEPFPGPFHPCLYARDAYHAELTASGGGASAFSSGAIDVSDLSQCLVKVYNNSANTRTVTLYSSTNTDGSFPDVVLASYVATAGGKLLVTTGGPDTSMGIHIPTPKLLKVSLGASVGGGFMLHVEGR